MLRFVTLVGVLIAVLALVVPAGAADTELPVVTLAVEGVAGTASDDVGVARVEVAIQDATTRQWWQPGGGFGTYTWLNATLVAPGEPVSDWDYPGVPPGEYIVLARAVDTSNQTSTRIWGRTTVEGTVVDTELPVVTLAVEGVAGTASDDVGVARVEVAIQDATTRQWWQPGGGFGTYTWLNATLVAPGEPVSDWDYPGVPPGEYIVLARAVDTSNQTSTRIWGRTTVEGTVVDTELPVVTLAVEGVAGTASDDVGVARVEVAIQDATTRQWWQPGGGFGTYTWLNATLVAPGEPVSDWDYPGVPPGEYIVLARAVDTSNQTSTRIWGRTTVSNVVPPVDEPSILLIMTDDQRLDDVWVMTNAKNEIADKGLEFTNGLVVNAWCCPSRISTLTGRYSHTTGVYKNFPPYGGYDSFSAGEDGDTLAAWLDDAGYRTGLFGKYLNGYAGTYVPPGWDHWVSFVENERNEGGAYFNYTLSTNGSLVSYGSDPEDYSTDVLSNHVVNFIATTPPDEAFFAFYTPFAPHGAPVPAPRHLGALSDVTFDHPPSYAEADVSDKPQYIQDMPPFNSVGVDRNRVRQMETLLALDEGIAEILDTLESAGRLENTLIIFMSDQGILRGEHNFLKKMVPYEESIRIPLYIRYDALIDTPRIENHIALNIDLAPTIVDLLGIDPPFMEGTSLMPLLRNDPVAGWRTDFLIEHLKGGTGDPVPSYCAVRTTTELYVVYQTGEHEYYDLSIDPYQINNAADVPSNSARVAELRSRVNQLCRPRPPGYTALGP